MKDGDDYGEIGGLNVRGGVGEAEVLGKNFPQCRSVQHRSHITSPGIEPDRRGGKPTTNRLSYGTAIILV
jgi:hypothetical protein